MRNTLLGIFSLLISTICYSQDTDKILAIADSLLEEGKFTEAISYYDRLIKLDASNEHYFRARGYSYLSINNLDEAESDMKKAIELNPDCSPCYMNLGRIEANRGNIDKGMELLNLAIEKDEKNDLAYLTRAKVKEYMNDQLGASLDYNKAIALNPKEAINYIERGKYRLNSSMKSLALRDFNTAFKLDSNDVDASYARAQYFTQYEDWDDALLDLNRCIKLDPNNFVYYGAKGTVLEFLGKHLEAIENYDISIGLDNSEYLTFMNRAIAKYSIEDMDGFCQDNKMALELIEKVEYNQSTIDYLTSRIEEICNSEMKSFYYQRGIAKFNLGEFEEAISSYDEGLKRFPDSPLLLSFRGNAYRALGKDKLAIIDYKNCLELKDKMLAEVNESNAFDDESVISVYLASSIATVYMNLAESYANLGKYETAVSFSDSAIGLLSSSEDKQGVSGLLASNYNTRGVIYIAMGEYEKSIKDFEQAIRLDGTNPLPFTNMALAMINKEKALDFKSISMGIFVHADYNGSRQDISMPLINKKNVDRNSLIMALSACDAAIDLDTKVAFSYLVRAQIKLLLDEPGVCVDMLSAKELGMTNIEDVLGVNCE